MRSDYREDPMTFCGLLHELAIKLTDKPAVVGWDKTYSYKELDEYSNDLANRLIQSGLEQEEIVAVSLGRSADILIVVLGIWKAGGAYLFLDSCYPEARNASLLEDTSCRLLIDAYYLENCRLKPETEYTNRSKREDLAVLVYTSGSTSAPKGVMIEHGNVMRSAGNSVMLGTCSSDHVCVFPSYSFVASIHDTFGALLQGATVYIIPEEYRRSIDRIEEYLVENEITMTYLPPHMARKLIEKNDPRLKLRVLLVGGEIVRNLRTDVIPIINVYASTETCSLAVSCRTEGELTVLPIGKPNPDMKAYVVDEKGRLLPDGEKGELWLSGPQITRGYYRRPEETAAAYRKNPFSREPGYERVFCTKDMVHRLDDGNLMYDGRLDHMLKIRGFRVEAGAVESVIMENAPVKEVVVTSFTDSGGTDILCAYFTSDKEIDVKALKRKLKEIVPYYMVPAAIIQIKEMPVNVNRKIDRKALAAPPELNDHKKLEELY